MLRGREESWCRISEQCRHSGSKVGTPGTIQFGLLRTTIENVRKGFALCIRSPLAGADALQTSVTSALHDKLLIYPRLVESAGYSGS